MITLRAIEPEDIDAIYTWENDPSLWIWSASQQPFSRHTLQQFIEQQRDADIYTSRQLRLMANDGTSTVGCIDLYDFDTYHHRAGVGIIVDRLQRNKGYAYEMLCQLDKFASTHLQLHQLYCHIAKDNTVSVNLFSRSGYSCSGVLQQWIWNGSQWVDALCYQKILQD